MTDTATVPVAMAQMLSARVGATLVSLGGMAVLARLLAPSDFGVFAVGLATFATAKAISEFGLVHDLVRRDELTSDDLRSAAGLALALAVGLGSLAVAVLVVTGRVGDGETAGVVGFLAAALVAEAVAMPYEARRRRSIEFRLLSVLAVAQAGVEVAVGVALALAGLGPAALAAGVLGSRAVAAVLLVAACPAGERPWPTRSGWGRFARFGGGFVTARLVSRLGELAIVGLISAGLGVRPLGLYNRSGAIHSIPDRTVFEAINPVILPALTRALRERETPAKVYVDKVDYLAAVCWPAFGVIIVLAEPMVAVVLGPQWGDAVTPVRILAVGGMVMPFTKMSMKLFIAVDRIDVHLRVQVAYVVATVVGAAVGSAFSLEAVCVGIVAAQTVQTIGVWSGVAAAGGEPVRVPWWTIARGALLAAAAAAGPWALWTWFSRIGYLEVVAGSVVLSAVGWSAMLVATRHRLLGDLRALRDGRRAAPVG
ncbi:oligosaccharide flippase family protein [Ilumatobacter sp.]|uniref:oligosaccharide flippase family protein n=1 Tax=Ilumatobacter sp. TaxID=1967498 RepID=UPI003B52BE00